MSQAKCTFPKSQIEHLGRFWAPKWAPKVAKLNLKNETKKTTKKGYQNEGIWGPTSAPKKWDFSFLDDIWSLDFQSCCKLVLWCQNCIFLCSKRSYIDSPRASAGTQRGLGSLPKLLIFQRLGAVSLPRHWGDGGASPRGVFDNLL